MNLFSLEGKRALVTGGSRGIGLGIAHGFAQAGAEIVLVSRNREGLEAAKQALEPHGRAVATYAFDLGKTEAIGGLYGQLTSEVGPADILVNNAGVTWRGPAEETPLEEWERVLSVNLTAAFVLSQAFARERLESGRKGKVINIASLMSQVARPTIPAYVTSKGGIVQLTRALAVEWAPHGINVNAIGPGFIKTEMNRPLYENEEFDNWICGRVPMNRWGSPDELQGAAVFLASAASDFMTGQVIYVDGGFLASC